MFVAAKDAYSPQFYKHVCSTMFDDFQSQDVNNIVSSIISKNGDNVQ